MPKQRGGWKGNQPAPGKVAEAAAAKAGKGKRKADDGSDEDNEMLMDEIDRFHRKSETKGAKAGKGAPKLSLRLGDDDEDEDDDSEDEALDAPVMGLEDEDDDSDEEDGDGEDDDDEEDEDEDEDDDDSEDEEEAEEAEAARKAAIRKEDGLLTAWGRKKGAYYYNAAEGDVEVDEEAAAAEEAEALRLQRQRAEELDGEDAGLGIALGLSSSSSSSKTASGKKGLSGSTKGASSSAAGEKVGKNLSSLSRQQKLDILTADTPELIGLVQELNDKVAEIRRVLQPALAAVTKAANQKAAGGKTKKDKQAVDSGLSYLQVKQQLLLTYLSSITFYLLLKAEGRPVADHPVIVELVRVKALLDRMRPLDARMAPTIARLTKAAADGGSSSSSAGAASLHHAKPNPSALLGRGQEGGDSDDDDDEANDALDDELAALEAEMNAGGKNKKKGGKDKTGKGNKGASSKSKKSKAMDDSEEEEAAHDDDDDDAAGGASGTYKPLRRAAVPYDDDPVAAKAARQAERRKDYLSRSSLLAEMRQTFTDAPEEAGAGGGAEAPTDEAGRRVDETLARRAAERRKIEEDAFTRLQPDKQEKKARKARERERGKWDALAELEQYGDLASAAAAGIGEEAGGADDDDEAGAGARGSKGGGSLWSKKHAASKQASSSAYDRLASAVDGKKGPLSGNKRGRPQDEDDGGRNDDSGDGGEDEFYASVAAAAAAKKAKRARMQEDRDEEARDYIRALPDEDALDEDRARGKDGELHRKASKTILANRGLVKYRRKDDKNPRTNYRRKAELAVKRRKGQVRSMRDAGDEAGRYGGEATGIRSGVVHSRKIKS